MELAVPVGPRSQALHDLVQDEMTIFVLINDLGQDESGSLNFWAGVSSNQEH